MWFLALLISFFAGIFSTLNLYGSIFIALPYLSRFGNKYNNIKNSYWITILIHSIFTVLAIYLCFAPLKQFAVFIIIGYFIIPIFIVIGQKDNMLEEVRERINEQEEIYLRYTLSEVNQQLIKNLELLALKLEKLYSGEKVIITKADISNSAINLVQFRDKLPKAIYDKAFERYNYYQNLNDDGVLMDLAQFSIENRFMQMEFSQLLKRKISHEGDILDEVYVDENFESEEVTSENNESEDIYFQDDDEDDDVDDDVDDEDNYGYSIDNPILLKSINEQEILFNSMACDKEDYVKTGHSRIRSEFNEKLGVMIDVWEVYCKNSKTENEEIITLYVSSYPLDGSQYSQKEMRESFNEWIYQPQNKRFPQGFSSIYKNLI